MYESDVCRMPILNPCGKFEAAARGVARNLAMGGGKILDRKPHVLINAETGSNYYSVRVPANNTLFCQTITNREMLMS